MRDCFVECLAIHVADHQHAAVVASCTTAVIRPLLFIEVENLRLMMSSLVK